MYEKLHTTVENIFLKKSFILLNFSKNCIIINTNRTIGKCFIFFYIFFGGGLHDFPPHFKKNTIDLKN